MRVGKLLIVFVVFLSTIKATFAITVEEIMRKVDEREAGRTQISTATMTLVDKKDRKRIRKLKLFSKEFSDVDKTITFFLSPADVKDTSFLS